VTRLVEAMAAALESETKDKMDAAVMGKEDDDTEELSLEEPEEEDATDVDGSEDQSFITSVIESSTSQPSYVIPLVAAFGGLLLLMLLITVVLCCQCRRVGKLEDGVTPDDPIGTKVYVNNLKGGQVMVKKVIPMPDGSDVVHKTVYPDRETAAGHGFVPEM
jgi:hypothetical protein